MNLNKLPVELENKIIMYLQNPVSILIKNIIECYETDYNWSYTKHVRLYYVKNFMSFAEYYFDIIDDPFNYKSYYENRIQKIL